jgi:hypothetical protein
MVPLIFRVLAWHETALLLSRVLARHVMVPLLLHVLARHEAAPLLVQVLVRHEIVLAVGVGEHALAHYRRQRDPYKQQSRHGAASPPPVRPVTAIKSLLARAAQHVELPDAIRTRRCRATVAKQSKARG